MRRHAVVRSPRIRVRLLQLRRLRLRLQCPPELMFQLPAYLSLCSLLLQKLSERWRQPFLIAHVSVRSAMAGLDTETQNELALVEFVSRLPGDIGTFVRMHNPTTLNEAQDKDSSRTRPWTLTEETGNRSCLPKAGAVANAHRLPVGPRRDSRNTDAHMMPCVPTPPPAKQARCDDTAERLEAVSLGVDQTRSELEQSKAQIAAALRQMNEELASSAFRSILWTPTPRLDVKTFSARWRFASFQQPDQEEECRFVYVAKMKGFSMGHAWITNRGEQPVKEMWIAADHENVLCGPGAWRVMCLIDHKHMDTPRTRTDIAFSQMSNMSDRRSSENDSCESIQQLALSSPSASVKPNAAGSSKGSNKQEPADQPDGQATPPPRPPAPPAPAPALQLTLCQPPPLPQTTPENFTHQLHHRRASMGAVRSTTPPPRVNPAFVTNALPLNIYKPFKGGGYLLQRFVKGLFPRSVVKRPSEKSKLPIFVLMRL
ncbi:unnamed protein product [Heligmosomoides polygyrus]|uniref:FH2 domain-containing protein n=1 Tax=Heligmosomoides polygyrus TaxID=6339 RepID=A0A183GDH6_HELPZ|nr:unnamed protein product [Heligmosomoides polygyrus]